METKKDLLTGVEFGARRSNQKFQNSANRIKFNNERAKAIRKDKAMFDQPLAKNYKILKALMGDEMIKEVHKEYLKGMGFEFKIYTHQVKLGNSTAPAYYHYRISTIEGKADFVRIDLIRTND